MYVEYRWLVDNESDACDHVRGTVLGEPLDVDYDELKTQAAAGEVDWVPPAFVYLDGEGISYDERCLVYITDLKISCRRIFL